MNSCFKNYSKIHNIKHKTYHFDFLSVQHSGVKDTDHVVWPLLLFQEPFSLFQIDAHYTICPILPSPQPLVASNLFSISMDLLILNIL